MAAPGRYVRNELAFKEDAYAVLQTKFPDRAAFEAFYASLATLERKNEFLRACCTYRYSAKDGDWKICVAGYNEVIDYLTNSYKLIAIFSLIESLLSDPHQDFYEWLISEERASVFPLRSRSDLHAQYKAYKASYGAIRKCVAFFERINKKQQRALCESIQHDGKPIKSIKKFAEYLYLLRSKFVHEAQLVLEIGNSPIYSVGKKGVIRSSLSVSAVFDAFESGLIAHFRDGT